MNGIVAEKALLGILSALVISTASLNGQGQKDLYPRLNDYPVADVFTGTPAQPKLLRRGDKLFRTMIREGAAKGPNFAGHYTIAEWGCGTSCVSIAVIDAKTGDVYSGPFGILGYSSNMKYADVSEAKFEPLSYNVYSRLLIVRGCPEDENCGSFFYEWRTPRFRLIRKFSALPLQR